MLNPKNISIAAFVGFFLSFFIGLFSDVKFSHVLLRALIFAVVFAALYIGISFLYQKFLSSDNSSMADSDFVPQRPTGSVVNIVVDDSTLQDDGMSPKFTVLKNHVVGGEKPHSDSAPVSAPQENPSVSVAESEPAYSQPIPQSADIDVSPKSPAQDSFKPMPLGDVTQKLTGSETVSAEGEDKTQQLDELPDISGMETVPQDDSASGLSNVEEVVTDTEFSTGGSRMREQPISGDTSVMAKAIQTLLAKDNS